MLDLITSTWPNSIILAIILLSILMLATSHILRTKNDVSSAIAWIGLVWLAPIFGLLFYFLFGISRIRKRAQRTRVRRGLSVREATGELFGAEGSIGADMPYRWRVHDRLAAKVSGVPVTLGNRVEPLASGRDAYSQMIAAIDGARQSVALCSYIFQADQAGRRFIAALVRAKERGVEVRVLVDAIGNLYGLKPVTTLLRRRGVKVATYNPARISWRLAFFNLRTHRKILVTDGMIGFAGGMNIRRHHLESDTGEPRVRDLHFRGEGPVVQQMMMVFRDDWAFSTGEDLSGKQWFPDQLPLNDANIQARTLADGPDEPFEKTAMIIESALSSAYKSVKIITPYFLPTTSLISALKQAALRGVEVDIVTPEMSNLPMFSLVMLAGMRQMINSDCNIYLSQAPFDHTKLMIVDDSWVLFGSSNWDARSLRLNFEFNIECYSETFALEMSGHARERIKASRKLDLTELGERPQWKRTIGRILWLASPYL